MKTQIIEDVGRVRRKERLVGSVLVCEEYCKINYLRTPIICTYVIVEL